MDAKASSNRSRVVLSILRMASPVCAIESSRSLRCVVRNVWRVSRSSNCSMAIMLTGPSRSIFCLRSLMIASGLSASSSSAAAPEAEPAAASTASAAIAAPA